MTILRQYSADAKPLTTTEMFQSFLQNLQIDNVATISLRYGEITAALNKRFRNTESKTANSLQVGSYGRATGIRGISDLDMLYLLPTSEWYSYKDGGQARLLSHVRKAIKERYPKTDVRVDGLVVRVLYQDFHIEVQPVFEKNDGSFLFPSTANGGMWKTTNPRPELSEVSNTDRAKNGNLRRLCKMTRAWKNNHGLKMGGLLIDTLAYNFLSGTKTYDQSGVSSSPDLLLSFFEYLGNQPDQAYYLAVGSKQQVKVKKKFQSRARKAHKLCQAAIDATGQKGEYKKWRKLFGRSFPVSEVKMAKAYLTEGNVSALNTEEFIEDKYRIDIRYDLTIDCDVTAAGFRPGKLRAMAHRFIRLAANRKLNFHVTHCDVPGDYVLYWKVLNRGSEAVKRNMIRGQIRADFGQQSKSETSNFRGDHIVECYAVKNNVVVARNRVKVSISNNSEESE